MIDRFNRLLEKETGDQLFAARLSVVSETTVAPAELWVTVRDFPFDEGWLCLTDEVLVLKSAADLERVKGRFILSGELVRGSDSLHIRQAERGWTIVRLKTGEGEDCLMLRESFVSTEEKQQLRLDYEVFWRHGVEVYEPYAFRFTGFTDAKEGA